MGRNSVVTHNIREGRVLVSWKNPFVYKRVQEYHKGLMKEGEVLYAYKIRKFFD